MRQTGTGVFSTTDYLMLQFHSMFQEVRLGTQPIPPSSTVTDMDTERMRVVGYLLHSSKTPAVREFGSRSNGTLRWIMAQGPFQVGMRR